MSHIDETGVASLRERLHGYGCTLAETETVLAHVRRLLIAQNDASQAAYDAGIAIREREIARLREGGHHAHLQAEIAKLQAELHRIPRYGPRHRLYDAADAIVMKLTVCEDQDDCWNLATKVVTHLDLEHSVCAEHVLPDEQQSARDIVYDMHPELTELQDALDEASKEWRE